MPPLSSTSPVVALAILTQPVGTGPAFSARIWPEKVSFTTNADALNGAAEEGVVTCRPEASFADRVRLT